MLEPDNDWIFPADARDFVKRLDTEAEGLHEFLGAFQTHPDAADELRRLVYFADDMERRLSKGLLLTRQEIGVLNTVYSALTTTDGDMRGSAHDLAELLRPIIQRFFDEK